MQKTMDIWTWKFAREPLQNRQEDCMKTLMRWLERLQKVDVQYSIWCGTFLWLYRDWKFIDNDKDIGINVICNWFDYNTDVENKIYEAFKDWTLIRKVFLDWRPLQIAYMSEFDVIFDLTFYFTWIEKDKVVSYSPCWTVIEDNFFNQIIPSPAEEYLEKRYWDWKTPTTEFQEWNRYTQTLVSKNIVWKICI